MQTRVYQASCLSTKKQERVNLVLDNLNYPNPASQMPWQANKFIDSDEPI